jgi:GT2 family glycosyltransferase
MTTSPRISVVVATHNRADRLAALIAALRRQTVAPASFDVVIVDDGSSDATPEVLEAARAQGGLSLRTLRQPTARGPAAARNRGWRAATAPLVAFTDDDCVPTDGWLEALLAVATERPNVVVQGMTLPNPDEAHALDAYSKTMRITGLTPHFETCNIAYARPLLDAVGGFDESFPAPAGEDSDLGCNAAASGAVVLFAPDAVVHHAVHVRGPRAALKDALIATHDVQSYKLNPGLRASLPQGVFYDRSHALLMQAAYGAWLARRQPAAVAMCLPYLLNLRSRSRATPGATPGTAAYLVAHDLVQTAATIRGGIRHRLAIV